VTDTSHTQQKYSRDGSSRWSGESDRLAESVTHAESIGLGVLVLLYVGAVASFVISELSVAGSLGYPLDSGWMDFPTERGIRASNLPGIFASESPIYTAFAGLVAECSDNVLLSLLILKTTTVAAIGLCCWWCYRLTSTITGGFRVSLAGIALFLPLSPALIWTGASGLGMAWGMALVARSMLDAQEDRPLQASMWAGIAFWFTPGALPVIVAVLFANRGRRAAQIGISVMFAVCWIVWRLWTNNTGIRVPSLYDWWPWIANTFALIGATWHSSIHPPLLLILAGFGAWRLRGRGRVFVATVALAPVLIPFVAPHPGALGRHLFAILPAAFILAAVGLQALASRSSRGLLRGNRLPLTLLALYAIWVGPEFWKARTLYSWQIQNTVTVRNDVGDWLNRNAAPGESIATTAPGAITSACDMPVIDLTRYSDIDNILLVTRPRWVAMNIGFRVPDVVAEEYMAVYTVTFPVQARVYPPGPFVVFRRTYESGLANRITSKIGPMPD
jgi:hypothetical protein